MRQPWQIVLSGVAVLVSAAALVVAVLSATVFDDKVSSAPSGAAQPATPAATRVVGSCPDADTIPLPRSAFPPDQSGTVRYVRNRIGVPRAVECLVNAERAARGIAPLRRYITLRGAPPGLGGAASQHAREAVSRPWWGAGKDPHTNPYTGSTPKSRIEANGYCRRGTLVVVKENAYTGWGASRSTPRAAVDWWMGSPGHRETILDPQLKDTGIGAEFGSADPAAGSTTPTATYVQTFGTCNS
jgi:uncharacterized protein YkwD